MTVSAGIITIYCSCLGHGQVIHFQYYKGHRFNRETMSMFFFFSFSGGGGRDYLREWNDIKDKWYSRKYCCDLLIIPNTPRTENACKVS